MESLLPRQSDLLLSERLAQACPQKEIQTNKQGKAYVYSHVCLYIRTYVCNTNKQGILRKAAIYFSDNLCIAGSIQGFQGYLLSKGNF